jgi:hypothetical protein
MEYTQTPKTWYNRQGGYIIKTTYHPQSGQTTSQTLEYNRLVNPMKSSLPQALMNDALDWRNVVRENRKNE